MNIENLQRWCSENKLSVSVLREKRGDGGGEEVTFLEVKGEGRFLFLSPWEGKIIDEDFAFIMGDSEFAVAESGEVRGIVFEFGGKFYCSPLKKGRTKYDEEVFVPVFEDFKYMGECMSVREEWYGKWVALGAHTEYEMMNGSGAVERWARKAKFIGCGALGVCDRNTLAAAMSFQGACDKMGLKAIIGETISFAIPSEEGGGGVVETYDLKFYVESSEGWENLLWFNKRVNVDSNGKWTPEGDLTKKRGRGLICVIPRNSRLNLHLRNSETREVREEVERLTAIFDSSHLYYQIDPVEFVSPVPFRQWLSALDGYLSGEWWKRIKPILIGDAYYLDREESGIKAMLNKVSGVVSPESDDQWLKDYWEAVEEYEEWYDDVPLLKEKIEEGARNAMEVGERVRWRVPSGTRKLPRFSTPNGESVEDLFYREIERGWQRKLGGLKGEEEKRYMRELETECGVIVPNDLCDYFMILWDIIRWARESGINTGPGRGSVCGSLVAYLLDITEVDPLKYGLMFERFLNETRVSGERAKSADALPDIDSDFPTEYRDVIKEYIKERYGYSYTCSVGTYTRMKLKTCIKDFGKIKGLPFDLTNRLTKDIDDQIEYTWGDLIEYASKSKMLFRFVQENPDIVHYTKYALQQPKAESIHPSAVIIVPREGVEEGEEERKMNLWKWMPVKKIDGVLVSEWEGKYVDKSGFLKEDILGLSQLDKFANIIRLIRENGGGEIDVNHIPLDDKEVFKYFKRGWNEDVFQFGTTGLSTYCRQVRPDTLEQLIAMTALFRPGPMDINAHQDYADIKNGRKKPRYDVGMREITEETMGLYVYQEQVMKAVVVGGLTKVESDVLRTSIKKKDVKTLASFHDKFISGYERVVERAGEKSPKEYAERVWNKLMAFAGYGFNKSHAAAYSLISYWSQWFKVNYPLEFWTTALHFSKESEVPYRLAELKKTGVEIEVRPPDINFSSRTFTCDPKEQRIFFSLEKIKQVGEVAVKNIIDTREEGGEFFSLEEFISRVPSKVNKTVIKALIIAGAFDLVEGVSAPRERKKVLQRYLESRGDELPEEYRGADSATNSFWIGEQKRLTGFGEVDYESMIRDSIPNKLIARIYVDETGFGSAREGAEVAIAGKLIFYRERDIKSGTMATLQIDCNNVIINAILWPDVYEKYRNEIEDMKGGVVVVNGEVKKDAYRNERNIYSNRRTKLYLVALK